MAISSSMPPIVFFQQGAPAALSHLNCALLQARWWNPGREIFVIGDAECQAALVVPGVEFVPIDSFRSSAGKLREVYLHLSSNSPKFEIFCLERWFVLRDFLHQRQLGSVWHFDSDVLVYEDLSGEDTRIASVDFSYSKISGHSAYFRINALDQLCSFILENYHAEPQTRWLQASYEESLAANDPDGISDMFFIRKFTKIEGMRSVDFFAQAAGVPVFDSNIRFSEGYEMDGDLKRITFRDQQPHALEITTQQLQRFATLHFQYSAKQQMPRFLRPPSPLPEWSLGVMTQLLMRLQTFQTVHHGVVQKQEQKLREKTPTTQSMQPIIKSLRSILDSRWLRLGDALRVTRVARNLQESINLVSNCTRGDSER